MPKVFLRWLDLPSWEMVDKIRLLLNMVVAFLVKPSQKTNLFHKVTVVLVKTSGKADGYITTFLSELIPECIIHNV